MGGILGPLDAPEALLLGRPDEHGRLQVAGRTTPLTLPARRELGALLVPPAVAAVSGLLFAGTASGTPSDPTRPAGVRYWVCLTWDASPNECVKHGGEAIGGDWTAGRARSGRTCRGPSGLAGGLLALEDRPDGSGSCAGQADAEVRMPLDGDHHHGLPGRDPGRADEVTASRACVSV